MSMLPVLSLLPVLRLLPVLWFLLYVCVFLSPISGLQTELSICGAGPFFLIRQLLLDLGGLGSLVGLASRVFLGIVVGRIRTAHLWWRRSRIRLGRRALASGRALKLSSRACRLLSSVSSLRNPNRCPAGSKQMPRRIQADDPQDPSRCPAGSKQMPSSGVLISLFGRRGCVRPLSICPQGPAHARRTETLWSRHRRLHWRQEAVCRVHPAGTEHGI